MAITIHPTAIVSPKAEIGDGTTVGPFAIIHDKVTVGADSVIGPHAILESYLKVGARAKIGAASILGGDPQDLKYKGEETWALIGDDCVFREYVTVNRGTIASFKTTIGNGCLLMSYVHVGHDCHIADGVIVSSSTGLAGHVEIGERAIINGMVGVAQFVRIGLFAYVGGHSAVRKDIPPYCRTDGDSVLGYNKVGLQRAGVSPERLEALGQAYRVFFRSSLNISQALEKVKAEPLTPEVEALVQFIETSERGVIV